MGLMFDLEMTSSRIYQNSAQSWVGVSGWHLVELNSLGPIAGGREEKVKLDSLDHISICVGLGLYDSPAFPRTVRVEVFPLNCPPRYQTLDFPFAIEGILSG